MKHIPYKSHIEFLNFAIDLHEENPKATSLDLKTENCKFKNNEKTAAVFSYPEKIEDQLEESKWVKWQVHYDTMFAPLMKAQELIDQGVEFPFESGPTKTGKGTTLKLIEPNDSKNIYIYKIEQYFRSVK